MKTGEIVELRELHLERVQKALAAYQQERRDAPLSISGERLDGTTRSHMFVAWLDIEPDLSKIRWFSGQARQHSHDAMHPPSNNKGKSFVSGYLAKIQAVSQPVIGISLEGLIGPTVEGQERDEVFARWRTAGLFTSKEIDDYPNPKNKQLPPHKVYEATMTDWRLFDSVHESLFPRYVILSDEACEQKSLNEPRFGTHEEVGNPHLHLPLTLAGLN